MKSNLKKSKTKKKKTLKIKQNENENNNINLRKKENNKEKENIPENSINDKIIFMNDEEKEGYCVNKYDNGDCYFGYYDNDLRNHHGFYYYRPININDYKLNRSYFGLWKNDMRNGYGIYLWAKLKEKQKFYGDFDNSNFKAYVGIFNSDNLAKGTYLSKEGNDYFVYHGTFSENNKKRGKNCFYYSSNLEELLYGSFEENEFIEGYIAKFNDEGEINDIVKYNNNNGEKLERNNKNEAIKELMITFRDCIISKDYFGIIYNVFSNILEFKDKYLFDIDVINTNKNSEFLHLCQTYKKITIYQDIEKYVKY